MIKTFASILLRVECTCADCDQVGSTYGPNEHKAAQLLRRLGWVITNDVQLCPRHSGKHVLWSKRTMTAEAVHAQKTPWAAANPLGFKKKRIKA